MNEYMGYTIKIDFSEEDSCWFGVASDISRNHIIMEDGDTAEDVQANLEKLIDHITLDK